VLLSATSLEFGGALAKTLFASLGPIGTLTLRGGFAAIALLLIWRPNVRRHARSAYWLILLFGLALAAMNLCFYLALSRIPLAVAVTIELLGPLTVAALGSRSVWHGLWVLLAAVGVLGFAPIGTIGRVVDPLGIGIALLSGLFCAMYILLSARVGRSCKRGDGLALAVAVAAIVMLPAGVVTDGSLLLQPHLLLPAAGVALLCSVVPYSLEIEALRRIPTRVFGVLVSLEPAIASLAGWVVLHEYLGVRAFVAIAFVTLASAGATLAHRPGTSTPS
jgi:inner membrane transporter RhtA